MVATLDESNVETRHIGHNLVEVTKISLSFKDIFWLSFKVIPALALATLAWGLIPYLFAAIIRVIMFGS